MKLSSFMPEALLLAGFVVALSGCSRQEQEKQEATREPDPAQIVVTVDGVSQNWADMNKRANGFLKDEITMNHLMIPENKKAEALRHFQRRAIRTFVFKTVLMNEAKRLKIEVGAADREQSLKNLQRTVAAKNWTTNDFFNKGPMDPPTMHKEFEDSIIIDKLLYSKVYSKIKVDQAELDEQIKTINATNSLIRAEMEKIREQVNSGATDFAAAARTFSRDRQAANGGDMGEVVRDGRRLNKALEDLVFSLKPGELSGVLRDGANFAIYKVISKAPAKEKTATTPALPETVHLARITMPCIPVNRIKIMDAVRKVKCDKAAAEYYLNLLRQASVDCPLFPDMKFGDGEAKGSAK